MCVACTPCQVLLNVFEYFMFWSAFFVLRGSAGNDANRWAGQGGKPGGKG